MIARMHKLLLIAVSAMAIHVVLTTNAVSRQRPRAADYSRTLLIAKGNEIATAFLHVRNGHRYWLTARSILLTSPGDTLVIYYGGRPVPVRISILKPLSPDDRVAVFEIPGLNVPVEPTATPELSLADTIQAAAEGLMMSYPLQLVADVTSNLMPTPFVTGCTLAAANFNAQGRPVVYYLDGQFHRGCAGAPIYLENTEGKLRVVGIAISAVQEHIGGAPGLEVNSGLFEAAPLWFADAVIEASQQK